MLLEVCVDSVESAILAEKGGAKRIELCASLELGGLTPSIGLMKQVMKHIQIPVFCMLRPRSGDFCYSHYETATMIADAEELSKFGASGFVVGLLDQDRNVDVESCKRLISEISGTHSFTFHRAFDYISAKHSLSDKLETVSKLGFSRVLTTGGIGNVSDNLDDLLHLNKLSQDYNLLILPGGGVNTSNVDVFKENGFTEIHASCSVFETDGDYGAVFNNPLPKGQRKVVSVKKVQDLCMES